MSSPQSEKLQITPKSMLLIIDRHDMQRLEYENTGREFLSNEDILVLPFNDDSGDPFIRNLLDRGLFRRKSILVQSPYNNDNYSDLFEAPNLFAIEKHLYFSQLCGLLGAKSVRIEQIDDISKSNQSSFQIQAQTIYGDGNLQVDHEHLNTLRSQLHLKDTFMGCAPQIDQAETLLRERRLLGDATMRSLLEMRRSPNLALTSRTLTLNLSTETKRILDIVGKLNFPSFLSDIQGNYKSIIHTKTEYQLTVTVNF